MYETLVVPPERAGLELDEFLCLCLPSMSKGFLRHQVREGRILLDGSPTHPSARLRRDQVVLLPQDLAPEFEAEPEPLLPEIQVLFEDDDVLAIDKPAGLAAEPERWAPERGSLAAALLRMGRTRERGEAPDVAARGIAPLDWRPRPVHRLDKDTTGVVLVAKHLESERELRAAFEHGQVEKHYLALVEGEYALEEGQEDRIDFPLAPDERRSGRMQVDERDGKPSATRVKLERRYRGYTLLCCIPETGRTHQIRVHLAARGFPLAVDPLYGRRKSLSLSEIKSGYRRKPGQPERPLIARQTLHAAQIAFPHRGGTQRVSAPLPEDFARLLKQLAKVRAPAEPGGRA